MRVSVPLQKSYKLINHGPTTLLTSAADGRVNVMPAAWVMPLDTDPARICAVISSESFTRELLEASGDLVVNVPTVAMAEAVYRCGQSNGRTVDKLAAAGLKTMPATRVRPPLVEGCVAWLECRLLPEPALREAHDLVLAEVVAAWADDEVFVGGEWHFAAHPERRTLHHLARGVFLTDGERVEVGNP